MPGRSTPQWRQLHSTLLSLVHRFAERHFYRRSRFVFAVSALEGAALERAGIRIAGICPNGVDLRVFSPQSTTPSTALRVVSIGSETTKKGLDVLLVALSRSKLRDATATRIVTRPENEEALLGFARSCGYENLTLVTRPVSGPENFRDADVYVAASREDSFNMPALEAMACGIPVVLSRRCGLAAWAQDAAILVDPTPYDIARAIERVLMDRPERERLVLAGRQLAEQMSWESTVAALEPALRLMDSEKGRR